MDDEEDKVTLELSRKEAEKIISALESENEDLIRKIEKEIDEDEVLNESF